MGVVVYARSMTAPALRARRDYKLTSLEINNIFLNSLFPFLELVVHKPDNTQQRNEGTQKVVKLI